MMIVSNQATTQGTVIGLVAPTIWSSYAVFAVLLTELPHFEVLTFSYLFAALMLLTLKLFRHTGHAPQKKPFKVWWTGFVGLCLCQFLYLGSFRFAPAAQADLMSYLWPVFILFGSQFLQRKTWRLRHIVSALLSILGLVALFLRDGQLHMQIGFVPGYLLAISCSLTWAYYSLALNHYNLSTNDILDKLCLVGMAGSILLHLSLETFVMPSGVTWGALVFSGAGGMALAYACWDYGMRRGHVAVLATVSYGIPVASTSLLVIFKFAESSWNLCFAILLITSAGWLSFSKLFATELRWIGRKKAEIIRPQLEFEK